MTHWWEKEPLRIIEICNALDLNAIAPRQEIDAVLRLGGNAQHFHCMNQVGGLDDTGFYFKTSMSRRDNQDRLGAYLPLAHRKGIRVIVYFNVHWYSREFGKQHPDWQQIKEGGNPIDDVYTTGTSFCVNSPYREWVFQIVEDLCKYELDGIFYDGPVFFDSTCYCGSCQRLFMERTGQDLPLKSNRTMALWREMIEFQSDSIARFLADSNSIIKKANPEILFCMNGNSNWPHWPSGRDNHKIILHTDLLGAEGGFIYGDLNQTPIYKPGIAARLLRNQAGHKPALVFDCAGHKPWSWYLLPRREIEILLAETLAGGANFWIPFFPSDLSQPELATVAEYCRLVKKHREAFFNTESLAKVALLWPSTSAEVYEGSSVPLTDFTKEMHAKAIGDIAQEFLGFYEGLARAQVPFDVIDEQNFCDLSKYDLLIFPNAAALSKDSCQDLRDFVRTGGNVVASFETSLYDEYGKRQDDFQLSDVLGVNFNQRVFGPMNWDYVNLDLERNSKFLNGLTKDLVPAPLYGIEVRPTVSTVLSRYCSKLMGCYDHTPQISAMPFLVSNKYGKGQAVYVAGTFGISVANFRFPEYLTMVRNLASALSKSTVKISNAPWIEVSLRRANNEIFLHLINQTCGLKRPITHVQPMANLSIELPRIRAQGARALISDRKLAVRKSKDGTSVVLPSIEEYEVIALKLKHSASSSVA